jgi:HEAT repeat protein
MSPYDALAALAERELELVSAGAIEELPALHDRRSAIVAALPGTPPAAARPALERTATIQALVSEVLEERIRATGAELRHLGQGRTAMSGYAPQIERTKLVDRAG